MSLALPVTSPVSGFCDKLEVSGFWALAAFGVDGAFFVADEADCPSFCGVPPGFLVSFVGVLGAPDGFPAAGEGAMLLDGRRESGVFLELLLTEGDVLVGVGGKE